MTAFLYRKGMKKIIFDKHVNVLERSHMLKTFVNSLKIELKKYF